MSDSDQKRRVIPAQTSPLKLDADAKIVDASSFNLEYCRIYPNMPDPAAWKSFNLIPSITKISLIESLTKHSVMAEIVMRDGGDALEKLKITGSERLHLKISQDTISEGLKVIALQLRVSDVMHYSKPTAGSSTYVIQAIPEPAYSSKMQIKNSGFSGSIKKLIADLMDDCGIDVEEDDNNIGEDGSSIITGVYPSLHPMEAISWLNKRAYGSDSTPYYFYNTCIGKEGEASTAEWRWSSLGTLMKQIEGDNKKPYRTYHDKPWQLHTREDGEKYYKDTLERIQQISSDLNLSVYNQMTNGGYASQYVCIDLSTKNVDDDFLTYPNIENGKGWKRLNKFPTYSTECTEGALPFFDTAVGANASTHYLTKNEKAYDGKNSYHSATTDNILKQQMYVTNFEYMKQDLELGGDLNLSVGKVIALDINEYDGKEKVPNKLLRGNYIVTELTHVFLPEGYKIEASVQKDSAAINYNEPIKVPKDESKEEDEG